MPQKDWWKARMTDSIPNHIFTNRTPLSNLNVLNSHNDKVIGNSHSKMLIGNGILCHTFILVIQNYSLQLIKHLLFTSQEHHRITIVFVLSFFPYHNLTYVECCCILPVYCALVVGRVGWGRMRAPLSKDIHLHLPPICLRHTSYLLPCVERERERPEEAYGNQILWP